MQAAARAAALLQLYANAIEIDRPDVQTPALPGVRDQMTGGGAKPLVCLALSAEAASALKAPEQHARPTART